MKFVKFTLFSLMLISIAPSLNAAKVSDFKAAAQKTNSYVSRLAEVTNPTLRKAAVVLSRAANVAQIGAGACIAGIGCMMALHTYRDRIKQGLGAACIISGLTAMKSGYDGLRK